MARKVSFPAIPNVQIGPVSYAVNFVKDLKSDNGTSLYGNISFSQSTINVDQEFANTQRQQLVMWHEVIHGILEVSGLVRMLGDNEEAFVETFTYQLVDVLNRNEDGTKWRPDQTR